MRHWSRYGVNGALEMTFMNYEMTFMNYLLDAQAPIKDKTYQAKPVNKWFTPALSTFKSARCHIERLAPHSFTSPTQTPSHSH